MKKEIIRMTEKHKMTFEQGMEKFIIEKKGNGLSEKTINGYCDGWKFLKIFLDSNNITSFDDISEDTIIKYKYYLRMKPSINDRTANTYVKNIRTVLYYFMDKGIMKNQFKIKLPEYVEKVPEIYDKESLEILLKKPKTNKFTDYRNWVIICFLLDTTVRCRTLLGIRVGDIDFNVNRIRIMDIKNKKQQFISMSKYLAKIMTDYLMQRKATSKDDYVFCTKYGEQMTYGALRSATDRYNKKLGVNITGRH